MSNPDSLASSGDFDIYTTLAAAEAGVTNAAVTRAIRCDTAGTLAVKRAKDGTTVVLPFAAGETQQIQIEGIVAASSAGCVTITVYR